MTSRASTLIRNRPGGRLLVFVVVLAPHHPRAELAGVSARSSREWPHRLLAMLTPTPPRGNAGSVPTGSNPHHPHLMAPGARGCADATDDADVIRAAVTGAPRPHTLSIAGVLTPGSGEGPDLPVRTFSSIASGAMETGAMTAAFAVPSVGHTTDTDHQVPGVALIAAPRIALGILELKNETSNRGPFFTPTRAEGRGRRNAGAARPGPGEARPLGKSRSFFFGVSLTCVFGGQG